MDKHILNRIISTSNMMISCLNLDLRGLKVVTECATGPYASTPILALSAGAEKVTAFGQDSHYGRFADAVKDVVTLARKMNISMKNIILTDNVEDLYSALSEADIVTNSGHLRPLDRNKLRFMRSNSAIPIMYEAWELRDNDIDLDYCREKGILVGGTNERHHDIDVFQYLGPIVAKAILTSHHEIVGERCLVISNNDMAPYIHRTLKSLGADVVMSIDGSDVADEDWDIIVIAATPPTARGELVRIGSLKARTYFQLWGDVDTRSTVGDWWPREEPRPGHMGLTLSFLGPTPVVKLQAGGLKCGEVMLGNSLASHSNIVQWIVGFSLSTS